MKPIIKWSGGKSRELPIIKQYLPDSYDRYIEPFAGGAALFFDLEPQKAILNDTSERLIWLYNHIKYNNAELVCLLKKYNEMWLCLTDLCTMYVPEIATEWWRTPPNDGLGEPSIRWGNRIGEELMRITPYSEEIVTAPNLLKVKIVESLQDKFKRLKPVFMEHLFDEYAEFHKTVEDIISAGIHAGLYYYFRTIYNQHPLGTLRAANFLWVREYAYGGMSRYDSHGNYNVPYGGISYNHKTLDAKIERIASQEMKDLMSKVLFYNWGFDLIFDIVQPTENDFVFLDPPYDTTFSTYDMNSFDESSQELLSQYVHSTPAKAMLVVKKTPLIDRLYSDLNIIEYDKKYACNIKNRNDREVQHLIITNY